MRDLLLDFLLHALGRVAWTRKRAAGVVTGSGCVSAASTQAHESLADLLAAIALLRLQRMKRQREAQHERHHKSGRNSSHLNHALPSELPREPGPDLTPVPMQAPAPVRAPAPRDDSAAASPACPAPPPTRPAKSISPAG